MSRLPPDLIVVSAKELEEHNGKMTMKLQNNAQVHVFTEEALDQHNLNIAVPIAQATMVHSFRVAAKKSPPQLMQILSTGCETEFLSREEIVTLLDHLPPRD